MTKKEIIERIEDLELAGYDINCEVGYALIDTDEYINLDNFIWKLKCDNLYTPEIEQLIEEYMKWYNG